MGIDEADSRQQQITWVSPLARTLLRSKVGDEVMLHTPTGLQPVEVLDVRYG
jgi:transcription elongation factor GreB